MAAERALAAKGLLAKGSMGNAVVSPLFKIAVQSAREMIRIGNEFGLTPCGRARIAAGGYTEPPEDDRWAGLRRRLHRPTANSVSQSQDPAGLPAGLAWPRAIGHVRKNIKFAPESS
jgi:hypothetical protein